MLRKLYYLLPPGLRLAVRRLVYMPVDLVSMFSRRDELIPPRGLIFTGSGDFIETGLTFLGYFIRYGRLKPNHHVLDVGSGIGRMAVALTGYLDNTGAYDGFDIVPQGIRWCQKKITRQFPNFQFRLVGLANDLYRTEGMHAGNFVFPYPDDTFDLVILTSVFTHMQRAEVENYLREIHRVLKPGGRVCMTFFLLNAISRDSMQHQVFRFRYKGDGCYLMDARVPSANVAYDETDVDTLLRLAGFEEKYKLYGSWSGRRDDVLDFQDFIVAAKG